MGDYITARVLIYIVYNKVQKLSQNMLKNKYLIEQKAKIKILLM